MIPLIKRLVRAFLFDEGAVTGWIRGATLMFSVSGLAFSNQIATELGWPGGATVVKWLAVICGFIAGAIRAGEKNITTQEPGKSIDVGLDQKIEVTQTPVDPPKAGV